MKVCLSPKQSFSPYSVCARWGLGGTVGKTRVAEVSVGRAGRAGVCVCTGPRAQGTRQAYSEGHMRGRVVEP